MEKVFARHLRLIGVFSGVRRNLPREMCTKISIQHLANLQIHLQSHQLQRLSDHLLKANQYMPPSNTRTWQYLMDKKRNDLPYADVIPPNNIPDFPTHDNDQPQAVSDLADPDDLGTLVMDVYGQDHLQLPSRTTRSGRAYPSILRVTEHCCRKFDIALTQLPALTQFRMKLFLKTGVAIY